MSDTTIQITVSGDNAAETLEAIATQLPESAEIVTDQVSAPTLEDHFIAAAQASGDLPQQVSDWFAGFAASSGMSFMMALLLCGVIFAIAYGIERVLALTVLSRTSAASVPAEPGIARTGAGLRFGLTMILRLCVFFALVRVGFWLAFPPSSEAQEMGVSLLRVLMLVRAWYGIIETLAAPNAPARRASGLSDADAAHVSRATLVMLIVLFFVSIPREFVVSVVDAGQSGVVFAIFMRLLSGLAISLFFIAIRKPVGALIRLGFASNPDEPGNVVRVFALFWPVVYILLQVLQIAAEARGYLTGTFGGQASALQRSFGAIVLAPFFVAGINEWGRHLAQNAVGSMRGRLKGLFSLIEGAVVVGTGIFILYAWDIDPFATDLTGAKRILPGLVSAAIILVIGISLWRTINAFLDAADDGRGGDRADGADELPDGEGGVGGSRIETVLPVLRAVLAALIGTVTVLLVLSALGVEIAPLLAGAGILGLAIGFGAQKVVEDVISGVLYLVEDAFRKGEYIETAQGKGIVEAIMLRSVRLRHHRGPIFTIPFSAMGTIQNHSRDWVTVKMSFEVSADADLEKVRKLVKKVGAKLLDDPELEGQFLAPLKSQGPVDWVGSNYKIGVKFTTEPGKQFLIRRKALNAIQQIFQENNIAMAAPRVIVDTKEDIAAAAAKLAQDAKTPPGGVPA
ncbi:MAG: mechanosensitive ion channel family protein [Roseobacter sp.]